MNRRFDKEDSELNFDEDILDEGADNCDASDSIVDKIGNNDALCLDDPAIFDGNISFVRASLIVYVDKDGRYFATNEEPRFNPYTGKKIVNFFSIEDLDE